MKIISINDNPVIEYPYLNAGRRPGEYYVDQLPIHLATVDRLPAACEAIVVTADLQGREQFPKFESNSMPQNGLRLLGEVLPDFLIDGLLDDLRINPNNVGVLLAGDFYTVPALDKRGGSGDVTSVWRAFGDRFGWVAGVAGNHDTFGPAKQSRPRFSGSLHYLDGVRKHIGGLWIAGIGGIIGNPRRLQRREEDDYLETLCSIIDETTDVVVMHDGPNAPKHGFRGSSEIREVIEWRKPKLVVRGHCHWEVPFVELESGVQVLNVDARVVVLVQDKLTPN